MTISSARSETTVLEPKTAELRKRFRASARALMANRPLRERQSGQAPPEPLLDIAVERGTPLVDVLHAQAADVTLLHKPLELHRLRAVLLPLMHHATDHRQRHQ